MLAGVKETPAGFATGTNRRQRLNNPPKCVLKWCRRMQSVGVGSADEHTMESKHNLVPDTALMWHTLESLVCALQSKHSSCGDEP
jgi:hypothetical protein